MQIKQDAKVTTADGKDIGHVDRVVMNPNSQEITHLIVRQGWLFTEDKVLPFELIDHATDTEIRLRADAEELDKLLPFEETHYVPAEETDVSVARDSVAYAVPYLYYPGTVDLRATGYPYVNPNPGLVSRTERNIPDDTVALKENAKVMSSDGQHVGNVEQIISNAETGRATDFVVSKGLLLKEHKLIPNQWIRTVMEDEVRLAVTAAVINRLRDYEPSRS
ncbi:MAG: DUF2171 domain-containing protein [Anaerolineales bacterium]